MNRLLVATVNFPFVATENRTRWWLAGDDEVIPHVEDRAAALAELGWTRRAAEWSALVCLHSGVFTQSQYGFYFQTGGALCPKPSRSRCGS